MIDLHVHTIASSDGQHTPDEIFRMAQTIGLKAIAFADHNTVSSLEEGERLSMETGMEFIPAIELNTVHSDLDLHILAYFVEFRDPRFLKWLEEINEEKVVQASKRHDKLRELGFVMTEEDLVRFSNGHIPSGASFLMAILNRDENKGEPRLTPYITGDRSNSPHLNFYLDYLRSGKPAYVPLITCDATEAIVKIKHFSGIPILAHPGDTPKNVIEDLLAAGLSGFEAVSSRHSAAECEYYKKLSAEKGLIYTAGSDFHGQKIKPGVRLGGVTGNDYQVLNRLKEYRAHIL